MFAIGHAATSLLLKKKYPAAPMPLLLLSVQAMELLWVALTYAGVEVVTTEKTVRSVADIHLVSMPWSHSVATMLGAAVLVALIGRALGRSELGVALALGVASHLILDLVTHDRDLPLAPGIISPKLGLPLYAVAPLGAFFLELAYGVACWWIYRGSRKLLGSIVLFSVANLSMLSNAVPGPEALLANRPFLVTTVVFVQIVVTLVLVGRFARRNLSLSRKMASGHA